MQQTKYHFKWVPGVAVREKTFSEKQNQEILCVPCGKNDSPCVCFLITFFLLIITFERKRIAESQSEHYTIHMSHPEPARVQKINGIVAVAKLPDVLRGLIV